MGLTKNTIFNFHGMASMIGHSKRGKNIDNEFSVSFRGEVVLQVVAIHHYIHVGP